MDEDGLRSQPTEEDGAEPRETGEARTVELPRNAGRPRAEQPHEPDGAAVGASANAAPRDAGETSPFPRVPDDGTVRMPRPVEAPGRRAPAPAPSPAPVPGTSRPPQGRNPYKALSAVLALALVAVVAFSVGGCVAGAEGVRAGRAEERQPAGERTFGSGAETSSATETPDAAETPGADGEKDAQDETLGSLAHDLADKLGSIKLDDVKQKLSDAADKVGEASKDLASDAADLLDAYANQ